MTIHRYPDDPYDRIWHPWIVEGWQSISTNLTVTNDEDLFQVPSAVMQTAIVSSDISFSWSSGSDSKGAPYRYYRNIHYAEIDQHAHQLNLSRFFDILQNGVVLKSSITPNYMDTDYYYSTAPMDQEDEYIVSMRNSSGSDLPPIMNAVEVFYVMDLPALATDDNDGMCVLHFI